LLRQRKVTKKKATRFAALRGTLRCSTGQAAAELALRAQTVLADIPDQPPLLGGAQGRKAETQNLKIGWGNKLPHAEEEGNTIRLRYIGVSSALS